MALRSPRYWAVVVAAGSGTRMGGGLPKPYRPLLGRSVLEWSTAPFLRAGWIDGVVVVRAGPDASRWSSLDLAVHPKVVSVVGGASRAASVIAGLRAVASRCLAPERSWVLVHDGARPCLRDADLRALRDEASTADGGLLALPVTDTLKRQSDGRVQETVDRRALFRALTPQMFPLGDLLTALLAAEAEGREVTDEASAVEARGRRPRLIAGQASNLKVTYPEDLALAAFWLQQAGVAA